MAKPIVFDDYWMFSTDDEEETVVLPVETKRKRGRPPMIDKYPELPKIVEDFISDNSAEAHNRRRDAVSYTHGVSLGAIRTHVIREIPELESISKSTIHRMMQPARRGTINARRHTGIVNARIPPKRNNATVHHSDFRYTCASVNYINELASLCENECLSFSCDDKNKVNVGTLAVSRHFQIRRFFSTNDAPNYQDHDFPYPNSKLIPSGYMQLKRKSRTRSLERPIKRSDKIAKRSRSCSPGSNVFKLETTSPSGRKRISWPRSGDLEVYLQAGMFQPSNSQSHVKHLHEILTPLVNDPISPKTVVTVLADGGPDWSVKSLVNFINFGRLWKNLCLDGLIMATYAPRHSRFNPIERAWGPLSKWLTGVTLPRILDNENFPPCQQADLTEEEVEEKETRVFDSAIKQCSKYWHGKKYDGFPIRVRPVSCREKLQSDHAEIKTFVGSSANQISKSDNLIMLQKELTFLNNHSVRRTYQVEFYKCQAEHCEHCQSNPIKATNFFEILNSFGGKIPSPVPDNCRTKGEHMTLLRLLEFPTYSGVALDGSLPSRTKHGVCERGCRYVFMSAADKKRHDTLIHSKKFN